MKLLYNPGGNARDTKKGMKCPEQRIERKRVNPEDVRKRE